MLNCNAMQTITMHFPRAPSVNRIWRRGRKSTYKDRRAVDFCAVVLAERYRLVPDTTVLFPEGVAVEVCVTLHPKLTRVVEKHPDTYDRLTVRRTDLDAPLKVVLDALQHAGVYDDDKQVVRLVAELGDPVPDGGLTVTIGEANA